MTDMVEWIAAEASTIAGLEAGGVRPSLRGEGSTTEDTKGHEGGQRPESSTSFPARDGGTLTTGDTGEHRKSQNPHPVAEGATRVGHPGTGEENPQVEVDPWERREEERKRRIYRGRTVAMLRRYMRYSMETGRLPSLLGREFFRAKVTSYTVVTFEDRVIFVHDMERCLEKLDEFSRQIIARRILQEHDLEATARLLDCTERTVRTYVPIVLDMLSEILLDVGLLERAESGAKKSCQGGLEGEIYLSACEHGKNKF